MTDTAAKPSPGGVRLDARILPVPTSISPAAQARLHAAVGDDGTPHNALYPMPAHEDHSAWRAMQAAADAQYAAAIQDRFTGGTGRVETIRMGSATVHVATPDDLRHDDCVYIDLHGGALVFGGGEACRESARSQSTEHAMCCYGVDYRMPPEHPYPAALDDCMAVYRSAVDRYGANRVVIGGRSAGGNLAVATTLRARDEGLPPPAALVLLSPEVDLTESGDSFEVNRTVDVVLPNPLMSANLLYANGAGLSDPYLSPLFGSFSEGFPATFIQSGTRDLFLSNAVRLHRALRREMVSAELHVFEAMPHGGFGGTPEDAELSEEVARFVRDNLMPARSSSSCALTCADEGPQ